jgi:hypothetical protein
MMARWVEGGGLKDWGDGSMEGEGCGSISDGGISHGQSL